MSSFARFQERNKKRHIAQKQLNTSFVFKGLPSIEIKNGEKSLQASVVNKQEKDHAYIFTQVHDELQVGDVWTAKNLHLLIAEEITIIEDVNWRKYYALLCNVEINGIHGFFRGPEKSFINVALKQDVAIESQQKPILILPENVLDFEDKVMIGGRAWMVQEYDTISTKGLVYYSLRPTTISKEAVTTGVESATNNVEVKPELTMEDFDVYNVRPNVNIELSTEDGYFETNNNNIKVLKRTSSKIIFSMPFGLDEVVIKIKQKGDIVSKTYRVV